MISFLESVEAARRAEREALLASARSLDALPDPKEPLRWAPRRSAPRRTREQVLESKRALKMSQCLGVLQLHREGVGLEEIAARLGRTPRTVFRLLKRAKANPMSPTQEAA